MRPRVLIFSISYYPYVGGAEVAIKEVTNRLRDYDFEMITLLHNSNLPREERFGNVVIHRIGWGGQDPTAKDLISFPLYLNKVFFPIMAFFKARALHARQPFSFLWPVVSYAAFPAVFFSWSEPSVPYVVSLQDGDSFEHITRRMRIRFVFPLYKQIFKRARITHAISTYLEKFARDFGARQTKMIPNGINQSIFAGTLPPSVRANIRDALAISHDAQMIISASRLVIKNGLADLISSLQHLPPLVFLVIVGDGPLKDVLVKKASSLGVLPRVRFIPACSQEKLREYFAAADIFVRPSLSEGFGNVFIEAMASGLPVVGTPVGGIPDFLQNGVTGWLCEVENPKSIAQKVLYVLNPENEKLVLRVIEYARTLALERYTWDRIASEMDMLFKKLS